MKRQRIIQKIPIATRLNLMSGKSFLDISPAQAKRLHPRGHRWCVPRSACSAPRSCRSLKRLLLLAQTSTSSDPSSPHLRNRMQREELHTHKNNKQAGLGLEHILQCLTLSAGGALATALVFVELHQTCNGSNHISLQGKHIVTEV